MYSRLIVTVISFSLVFFIPMLLAEQTVKAGQPATPSIKMRDAKAFFDESFDDFQQELGVAVEDQKKAVLIMYEMDECPFCGRMKATVLNRSDIQDFFHKHFRVLAVDIEGDVEMTDFQGKATTQKAFSLKNRVRATPVFQFFGLDGKPLKNGRLTGATKNAEEFMLFGKYIVDGENEKQSFFQYKRMQKQ